MGTTKIPWSDWQVEKLREGRDAGLSAAEIGLAVGLSKGAVCGKAFRLGLSDGKRPLSMTRDAMWHRAKAAKANRSLSSEAQAMGIETEVVVKRTAGAKRRPGVPFRSRRMLRPVRVSLGAEVGNPAPDCVKLSLRSGAANAILHRRYTECAWPIGAVESEDFHFCCASVRKLGEPYCAEHFEMARRG